MTGIDFVPIKRTGTKKRKLMLWVDEYDVERMEQLEPVNITVQEKIRQMVKTFLDSGNLAIGNGDEDLEGL